MFEAIKSARKRVDATQLTPEQIDEAFAIAPDMSIVELRNLLVGDINTLLNAARDPQCSAHSEIGLVVIADRIDLVSQLLALRSQ